MNVKIKASGVLCLLGDDYERVYAALKKQLAPEEGVLFSGRTPGFEYLQWELPGEGWESLAEADPLVAIAVRNRYNSLCDNIRNRFATNKSLVDRILTLPDESYIYYRNTAGGFEVRLTAWGYKYPERILASDTSGEVDPEKTSEKIRIIIRAGIKPKANCVFSLNGMPRQTDADGTFEVGELPVGYQFDVEVDGTRRHVIVTEGEGDITIDLPAEEPEPTPEPEPFVMPEPQEEKPFEEPMPEPSVEPQPEVPFRKADQQEQKPFEPIPEEPKPFDQPVRPEAPLEPPLTPPVPEEGETPVPQTPEQPQPDAPGTSIWKWVLIVLALVAASALTYFICSQIL